MAKANKSVICFIENGTKSFETISTNLIDAWIQNHPNAKIIHLFNSEADIEAKNKRIEDTFESHCCYYGLQPDDLHTEFKNTANGHTVEVIGINSRNYKYPVIIIDKTVNCRLKVTPKFMDNLVRI